MMKNCTVKYVSTVNLKNFNSEELYSVVKYVSTVPIVIGSI